MWWIYLLLSAGIFMGWSLGTNDAANAFGTAVATGVVKYRTAVTIISTLVVIGAVTVGHGNLDKLSDLAISNAVVADEGAVEAAVAAGTANTLVWKSALRAAVVFACAGLTVFIMSFLKFPVSANQSITGAVIGWGLCYADYKNTPGLLQSNLKELGEFASTWLLCPLGAAIISFVIVFLFNKFFSKRFSKLTHYDFVVKAGYLIAGGFAAFSIGMNSSASVTAFYYGEEINGVATNLLSDARLTATIGGLAIALGVLTYSKKVMMTVGNSIAPLTQVEGFLVIIAMSLTIVLMGNIFGIPVSTSQAVVGAVVGAGLTKGINVVDFRVFKNIAIAWVSSPVAAALLTYVVGLCMQPIFK